MKLIKGCREEVLSTVYKLCFAFENDDYIWDKIHIRVPGQLPFEKVSPVRTVLCVVSHEV